ncbi:hypothetical protein KFU94_11850 [Chloroflexi bacterium TSY]|nr:hypothetical protein [Chloroflexi bacterium TSY]
MPSIKDIYPDKWLKAEHLNGHRPTVTIEDVRVERLFNPNSRQYEKKLVLKFRDKTLRMILNKTQTFALAAIAGDDYTQWATQKIVLSASTAPNNRPTILISPVPDGPPANTTRIDSTGSRVVDTKN